MNIAEALKEIRAGKFVKITHNGGTYFAFQSETLPYGVKKTELVANRSHKLAYLSGKVVIGEIDRIAETNSSICQEYLALETYELSSQQEMLDTVQKWKDEFSAKQNAAQ